MENQNQPSMAAHVALLVTFFTIFAVVAIWAVIEYEQAKWCNKHATEQSSQTKCASYYVGN